MKSVRTLLDSPAAFISGLSLAIVALGAALTSPIWFLVDGYGPVAAMRAGRPYEFAGVVGLVLTIAVGVATHRLRGQAEAPSPAPSFAPEAPEADDWKHRLVHLLVMLLFIVPFLTIVLGLILNQMLADAG